MTSSPVAFVARGHGRLKCDAPGCGYVETLEAPLDETMIGRPCPHCGASLLSAANYTMAKAMTDAMAQTVSPDMKDPIVLGHVRLHVRDGAPVFMREPD